MKKWIKRILVILFLGAVSGVIVLWIAAGSIASPERREIQEYHRSYLDDASGHGLVVTKHRFLKLGIPCLLVRPDGDAGVAERGLILRKQLKSNGITLPAFGEEWGILVLLHGRNGRKEDLLPVAERFCAVGLVCVIPDLPAHGESLQKTVHFGLRASEKYLPGKMANEAEKILGVGELPQFLWGMSMGGSFAIHAAAYEPEKWKRLIVVASFDRLDGVVEDSLSWASPPLKPALSGLISMRGGPEIEEVRPMVEAGNLRLPSMVIHGDEDELISHERGLLLYDSFGGTKEFLTVPGGNHDNVLVTKTPVYAAMARWYLEAR